MDHLNRTAGQTEGHRPQRAGARPVDDRIERSGDKPLAKDALNAHALLPVECAILPLDDVADYQNREKDHYRTEDKPGDFSGGNKFLKDHRPREEEGDFKVEQNEENGDQVIANVELHAGVFKRLEAAFVGRIFFRIGTIGGEQAPENDRSNTKPQTNEHEHQDGKIVFQHVQKPPFTLDDVKNAPSSLFLAALHSTARCCGRDWNVVPPMRLDLIRLSPLPPQDSVSTNFTASASCSRSPVII